MAMVKISGRSTETVTSSRGTVSMVSGTGNVGFKFIDCMAELYDPDRPDGYAEVRVDKHGDRSVQYSRVCGMVGGAVEVVVYPEQFGIPCAPGTWFRFWAGPRQFMDACVAAVAADLCPPDYVI